jgi:hypothetical protein
MKNKLFFGMIVCAALAIGLMTVGCATYQPVNVTNTMAAQFESVKFHMPEIGEEVKTMYVDRTGSFINDLNKVEGGTWYSAHRDKLVSIEATKKSTWYVFVTLIKDQWRVEYID